MDLTIYRTVRSVEVRQAQNGRTYWVVTDDTNQEWKCWDPNAAVAANNSAGTGQLMQLGVRVAPARDPQYGMNYSLRSCSLAPMGVAPTPAGAEHQQAQAMPGPTQQLPGIPQPQPIGQLQPQAPMPNVPMPQQQPMPQAQVLPAAGPQKTMGQGGNFSDLDILRMARSTSVEAAAALAAAFPPDFSNEEGNFDWLRFWLAAEAIQKHITHRAHEGWIPGQEMNARGDGASNEQQVLAEVHAQFPGTVEVPVAPQGVPAQASAENAEGGDIDWDNP